MESTSELSLTKNDINKRLQWIASCIPDWKPPSRAHLQRVNEVFLSKDKRVSTQTKVYNGAII